MGGGWCFTPEECLARASSGLGSSASQYWPEAADLGGGIFDNNDTVNPDFYNWNHVFFIYCDGASFAGDQEQPQEFMGETLYYRGYRNLKAIMRHLNEERGLPNATDVILTGCSAGGLAVFLHADFLRTLIVDTANYRALPDAGYFFDIPDTAIIANGFIALMTLQNIDEALIPACRADYNGQMLWKCISPMVAYGYIETPLFVLNSQYDSVTLESLHMESCEPPSCDAADAEFFQKFYDAFESAVQPVLSSSSENGYFLDSCYIHCRSLGEENAWSQFAVSGRTAAESFGDWYFNRSANTRLKDCPDFPCNPTCPADIPDGAVRNMANPVAFLTLFIVVSLALK